ncbi:MAG: carboxypeptidase regulatory-like domain-containing protein, partial [Xanthobacteraceae bacterium]|nr:carboxypeptidase regulatory-like domain-containing protein [Xanthobacteraceae bacterium]
MEGVLVSAQQLGSPITVTVVSDSVGQFAFPPAKLRSGRYALRIRAAGYDLDSPQHANLAAGQATTIDLKLRKTQDLASQLTSTEWL